MDAADQDGAGHAGRRPNRADDSRAPAVRAVRAVLERTIRAVAEAEALGLRYEAAREEARALSSWSTQLKGESAMLRVQLRELTSALARSERAHGAPPERVLILLKGIVEEAGGGELPAVVANSLQADVVRWGIEGYYAS
jgi:hypothetical protein